MGGVAANHTNEATLAVRADGSVLLNLRDYPDPNPNPNPNPNQVLLNLRDWSGRFTRQVQQHGQNALAHSG